MKRAWLLIPLGIALAGAGEAQEIRKCVGDGAVGHQAAPCTGTDAGPLRLPGYADPPERDGAMAPRQEEALAPGEPVAAPLPSADGASARALQQTLPFGNTVTLGVSERVPMRVAGAWR